MSCRLLACSTVAGTAGGSPPVLFPSAFSQIAVQSTNAFFFSCLCTYRRRTRWHGPLLQALQVATRLLYWRRCARAPKRSWAWGGPQGRAARWGERMHVSAVSVAASSLSVYPNGQGWLPLLSMASGAVQMHPLRSPVHGLQVNHTGHMIARLLP